MVTIADVLGRPSMLVRSGAIFLGPMEGVDHPKFYVIAGISGNRILTCSVLINSKLNSFILRRQHLLRLQVEITPGDYDFLDHVSYVNCASPLKGTLEHFDGAEFSYKAQLNDAHLAKVQDNIKSSGLLTPEEIKTYFD